MSWLDVSKSFSDRFLRREIVREDEIAFLFVDGRFERILPPGRHRIPPATRAVVERVSLAEPRVSFPAIGSILDREEVRRVTTSIHVEEGKLGLVFQRGVFHELLSPGLHVFVRAPDGPSAVTFDVVTPEPGAELLHPAADAIARAPDAPRWFKTVQIDAGSLGVLYVDGVLARRLDGGRHVLFEHGHALRVDVIRPFEPVPAPDVEALLTHPDLADTLTEVRVSDHERGLVFAGNVFRRFLAPGQYVFANVTRPPLRIEKVDVREPEVTHPEVSALTRAPDAATHLTTATVVQGQVGLLFVDGTLRTRLAAGVHAFWNGARTVAVQIVDQREVGIEVQGQELLTADKVSLRVNLSVRYRVVDVDRAVLGHADFKEALHRCLQLALRDEVQRLTLDELLSRKEDIGAAVTTRAAAGAALLGVEIRSSGLRDVILPGEMRQILNQVVEAERRAQANLITRREETAAARSLLNTARLLDENPTLMRLKELEHAERIAEKIGNLSVIGGIDALLPRIREALTPKRDGS